MDDATLKSIFSNLDVEPAGKAYIVVSGRALQGYIVHGVFTTQELAEAWAKRADKWRGRDHPLTPHRVEAIQLDPPLFPDFGAE